MENKRFEEWKEFAKNHHYLTNEWLEYIIKSDGIISDRGYKEICRNCLDTRQENNQIRDALSDMIHLIDEHGDAILKSHATRILKARKFLN